MFHQHSPHMIYTNDTAVLYKVNVHRPSPGFFQSVPHHLFFLYLSSTFLWGGPFMTFGCHWRNQQAKGQKQRCKLSVPSLYLLSRRLVLWLLFLCSILPHMMTLVKKVPHHDLFVTKWSQLIYNNNPPVEDDTTTGHCCQLCGGTTPKSSSPT